MSTFTCRNGMARKRHSNVPDYRPTALVRVVDPSMSERIAVVKAERSIDQARRDWNLFNMTPEVRHA